jgi:hypothetical protein
LPQPSVGQVNQSKSEEPKQKTAPEKGASDQVAPPVKESERGNAQKEAAHHEAKTPEKTLEAADTWHLSDKIAVGAVVAALFQFAAVLWTIRETRLSSQRELRAYVGIVGGQMTYINTFDGQKGLLINIVLKNFGQTPAYRLSTWIKQPLILDSDAVPFGNPTPIAERQGESFEGPGATFEVNWSLPINEEELATVNAGKKKIFVWGGANFTDAFGKGRKIIFRMTNDPSNKVAALGHRYALTPHKQGYEAD